MILFFSVSKSFNFLSICSTSAFEFFISSCILFLSYNQEFSQAIFSVSDVS